MGESPLQPQTPFPEPPPLTEDGVTAWKRRLTASVEPIKKIIAEGKTHTQRYQGLSLSVLPSRDTIVVPLDYSYTEQKKAEVFFQVPELHLEGKRPDCEAAAPLAQAVINDALGPDGVKAHAMMFEVLTDTLCGAGFGVSVIGYTPTIQGTKPQVVGQRPVPVTQPGAVLNLSTTTQMEDVIEPVPNIIAETFYWDRIPPGFLRVPAEFRGSDFDKSPWLAYRFAEDLPDGADTPRRGTSQTEDEDLLLSAIPTDQRGSKRWGTRVFYQAHRFDVDVKHPDLIRTFVLYDGEDTASDRKNLPYQRPSPDGSLIGMKGYPLQILTLRYLSDAWAPKSDVAMSRAQVDELSKGRTQMVQRRDRALPQTGYDATRVTPDTLAKIERNENTGFIGFNGPLEGAFAPIEKGTFNRENFEFDDVIKRDIDQTWALGASAGVLRSESPETATKSSQIQSAIDTRLEKERGRVLEFLVAGAMKVFSLKQLFATQPDYVRVLGPQGAAVLTQWTNAQIAGSFAFKAKPDSHIRLDAAQDREQKLRFYTITGQDPYVNRVETCKMLATAFGLDPARFIKQPDPKGPEPATGSIAFKVEDFVGPAAPIAAELAAQCGYKVSPQAMQAAGGFAQVWAAIQAEQQAQTEAQKGQPDAAQTQHPGAVQGLPPVDKHASELTGNRTGPAPL